MTHIFSAFKAPMVGAAASTLLLVGCGPSVLDFRNAQIVNGAIYRAKEDKPFSGRVTNVPESTILLGRQDSVPFMRVIGNVHQSLSISAPNPQSHCEVHSDDGVLDGEAVCRVGPKAALKYEMNFNKGVLDGPFKFHNPKKEGSLLAEASFTKGLLDGRMKVYGPSTGEVVFQLKFEEGRPEGVEELVDEKTGKLESRMSYRNGVLHGEVVKYKLGTDRLIHKSNYIDGKKDGVEENFDYANGNLTERRSWKLDKPHGDVVRAKLDSMNAPTKELQVVERYDNGVKLPVTSAAETPVGLADAPTSNVGDARFDSCVNALVAAHRKESNGGPYMTHEYEAWEAKCSEVKASN